MGQLKNLEEDLQKHVTEVLSAIKDTFGKIVETGELKISGLYTNNIDSEKRHLRLEFSYSDNGGLCSLDQGYHPRDYGFSSLEQLKESIMEKFPFESLN